MAVEATHVAQFGVAAVYFGLTAWLLYLDFARTINRILAMLFFLRGATISLNQLVTLDSVNESYWHASRVYFFIFSSFAILDFLIVYTWRQSSAARRGARRFLLGTFAALEVIYVLDHTLVAVRDDGSNQLGALGFLLFLYMPLLAIASLWFAWLSTKTDSRPQARFHMLISVGFAVAALGEAAGSFAVLILEGWRRVVFAGGSHAGAVTAQWLSLSAVPLAAAAIVWLAIREREHGRRNSAIIQIALGAAVILLPLVTRAFAGGETHSYIFFSAVPRALAPVVLVYALVRQVASGLDVFQLDLRTRIAVRRGTVGGILIAFFFIVSESAAQLFSQFASTQNLSPMVAQLVGIVGAAVLLVFLHPLNRLGERISTSMLPNAKPVEALPSRDRMRIYEEQVELAWADGSITRKERLLLDKLREQLELPIAEAVVLESKAARRTVV